MFLSRRPSSYLVKWIFGLLFLSSSLYAAEKWEDRQWSRLLHLEKNFWGHYRTDNQEASFFLSEKNTISPKNEYLAFEEQLKKNPDDPNDNVICRFPARWLWYKKVNSLSSDSYKISCPKLSTFKTRMAAQSASIVFSSFYLNNPSSSFGHTLIRLEKQAKSNDTYTELLDNGINYGAVTGNAGPISHTLGGLLGWFYGTYDAIPYYYKVREYNDYESRDLWSYKLNLSDEEINFLVDHLWELGHAKFDYYFLKKNCSYYVLATLETVRPELDLTSQLTTLYTIPTDTLKILVKENLVTQVSFRASPSSLFYQLLSELDPMYHHWVNDISNNPDLELPFSDDHTKIKILDTAIALFDFKNNKELLKEDKNTIELKKKLLHARAQIHLASPDPTFPNQLIQAPHEGHGSRRITMNTIKSKHANISEHKVELEWRYAFHDILDFDRSYPKHSQLEVGKIKASTGDGNFHLSEFLFMDLFSLGKWDQFKHSAAWKIKMGQWQTRKNYDDLTTVGVAGGYGLSYQLKHYIPYLIPVTELSYVAEQENKLKATVGADLGLLVDISESAKFHAAYEMRIKPWNESNLSLEAKISNKNMAWGLFNKIYTHQNEVLSGIKFQIYF